MIAQHPNVLLLLAFAMLSMGFFGGVLLANCMNLTSSYRKGFRAGYAERLKKEEEEWWSNPQK